MKLTAILTAVALLTGCSAAQDIRYGAKSETPIPKEELTAIASYSTKAGSYQIAFEQAEKFCNRWRAAPSVVKKQVKYNGQITEDFNTALNTAGEIARAAGNWVPGLGNKDAYETTLIYKCY